MSDSVLSPSRKWARRLFRGIFVVVALTLVVALGVVAYLQRSGLPLFLHDRISRHLASRGLKVQFAKLRLIGWSGVRAEEVQIENGRLTNSPSVYLREAEFKFNQGGISHPKLSLKSVKIADGKLDLPLINSNSPPATLSLKGIRGALIFLPGDEVQIPKLEGDLLGMHLQVSGALTHASYFPESFRLSTNRTKQTWQLPLQRLVTEVQRLRFKAPPEIKVTLSADGKSLEALEAMISAEADDVISRWAAVEKLTLQAKTVVRTNAPGFGGEMSLVLLKLKSGRGGAEEVKITGTFADLFARNGDLHSELRVEVKKPDTLWGSAEQGTIKSDFDWARRSKPRWPVTIKAWIEGAETHWGRAADMAAKAVIFEPRPRRPVDPALGFWNGLAPYRLNWEASASGLSGTNFQAEGLWCDGTWEIPTLDLKKVHVKLYGGTLDSEGTLNVASREAQAKGELHFDLKKIEPLLTPHLREWLDQFSWRLPPDIKAAVGLRFDVWTNNPPDWKGRVASSVGLAGDFTVGEGSFRTIPATGASSHFYFTNLVWFLPDLFVTRPEGALSLVYKLSPRLKQFYWGIRGQADPKALEPMIGKKAFAALDEFEFSVPPVAQGEIWGAWRPFRLAVRGDIAATNFSYRGVACSSVQGHVDLTNNFFIFTDVELKRGNEQIIAPAIGLDATNRLLTFTNATTHIDPLLVAGAIGRKVAANLKPYRFDDPPVIRVNGSLRVGRRPEADLWFGVAGGSFHYWKFNVDEIGGDLHWLGNSLTISNLEAQFYQGLLIGEAAFDFAPANRTDFKLDAVLEQADLNQLMEDLNNKSNKLEGLLSGQLLVTSANSKEWQSWQGGGHAKLREGLIWEIPLFGIFTPLFNKISPGLGTTPATEGTATFSVTNGIIHTDDLKIFSPALRLEYKGTVGFDRQVDGIVQAFILRDVWFIGRIFRVALSPITKLFEYKVNGTLARPKAEPLHIPKFFQIPFQTVRKLFPKGTDEDEPLDPSALPPRGVTDY